MKTMLFFQEKQIPYKVNNNQYYIAIRPICEVLGVEYQRQFKKISSDLFYESEILKIHTDQTREYFCIPEKKIYGWIFTLDSKNEKFLEYRNLCYDILFDYFKGSIVGRTEILKQKKEVQIKIKEIVKSLNGNEDFKKYLELKAEEMRIGKLLKENDDNTLTGMDDLF